MEDEEVPITGTKIVVWGERGFPAEPQYEQPEDPGTVTISYGDKGVATTFELTPDAAEELAEKLTVAAMEARLWWDVVVSD